MPLKSKRSHAIKEGSKSIEKVGLWQHLKTFFRLRHHVVLDQEVLDDIFLMERRTLITLILLETILLYILLPMLGKWVFVWYGLILTLSLWRYYNAHLYESKPQINSPIQWHKKFVVHVWLSALLFAILGLFAIPHIDPYYQLFIFIVIVGISSGALKTLDEDQRTAIGYLLILLLPLIVEMLLLDRKEILLLAFLTLIYLVSQINTLVRAYERYISLKESNRLIEKTKEELYEKEEMIQSFFEQADDGIFTYDRELRILDYNNAFLRLTHLKPKQIESMRLSDLKDRKLSTLLQASNLENAIHFEGSFRTSNGMKRWVDIRCSPIRNVHGVVVGGVGLLRDKTEEHITMEELEFLASHDPLTMACNRRAFRKFLKEIFQDSSRPNLPTLIFILDIKNFKQINNLYGQSSGDQILIESASRLRRILPSGACLSRMQSDEFSIVIPFLQMPSSKTEDFIEEWIDEMERILNSPFSVGDKQLKMQWSFGVLLVEPETIDIDELLRRIDVVMQEAQVKPELRYIYYSKDMGERYRLANLLYRDLQKALVKEEFELYFQAIVQVDDLKPVSAEVLVRWRHPKRGLLSPGVFLDVARQFNIIIDLDLYMLRRVCQTIAEWKSRGIFSIRTLTVNVDSRTLLQDAFPEFMRDLITRYEIAKGELTIEIVEETLVEDFDLASNIINRLRELGVECALDDFGTGYSSLSYLNKLSFDTLKIDREFVQDSLEGVKEPILLQSMIELGRRLNYSVVVEGVETRRQLDLIRSIDPKIKCQGYFIGKPIESKSFINQFLKRGGSL